MRKKGLILLLAAAFCAAMVGTAMAQSINVYMGLSPENNKKVADLIKAKTGITVNQTFQSFGEIEAKLKSEAPNFNADMVLGCGSSTAFMAKKNGWSVAYMSPTWKGTGDVFHDPQGLWYNMANFTFVIVGNKDRLAKAGLKMPESWQDLLDPKWKGEIVMPSPLSSGTANMMRYTWLGLYGDDAGWKYIEALDKNIAFYTRSGNAPTDLVGRGEFMLGITSHENVGSRLDQGYPLLWTIPKEGTGYDGTFMFLLKGADAKKMDLCKKVLDFMGGQEASDLLAGLGYITPRPAPNKLFGKTLPKFISLDLSKASDERAKNNELWKAKFRTDFK